VPKRLLIIDGHPDPSAERFVHALAEAYVTGARAAGHEVRILRLAEAHFELLRSNQDFLHGAPAGSILQAQADLTWCEHVTIFYPLWLGAMPALLKGFLEQTFRPGFAFGAAQPRRLPKKLLKGRSARIVVTMGMPAFFYKWFYRAHSLKSLERNILKFVGFDPVRATVVGSVDASATARLQHIAKMHVMGKSGR
jgi:putative NADPH-quinone reductase